MRTAPALLVAVALLPAAADAKPACDTSTDEATSATYERLTGRKVEAHRSCVRRADGFPGLVTVGSFAHDRGCMGMKLLDLCAPDLPAGDKDIAARAMKAAGWDKADDARRGELALAWAREVLNDSIVWQEPDYWKDGGKPFTPPSTKREGTELVARYWAHGPVGMRPVHFLSLVEVRFDQRGVPGEGKVLDKVAIEIVRKP